MKLKATGRVWAKMSIKVRFRVKWWVLCLGLHVRLQMRIRLVVMVRISDWLHLWFGNSERNLYPYLTHTHTHMILSQTLIYYKP